MKENKEIVNPLIDQDLEEGKGEQAATRDELVEQGGSTEDLHVADEEEAKPNRVMQAAIVVVGALLITGSAYYMWANAPWMEAKNNRKNQITVRDPKATATPMPDDSGDVRRLLDQFKADQQPAPTQAVQNGQLEANAQDGLKRSTAPPAIPAAYWTSDLPADGTANKATLAETPAYRTQPNGAVKSSDGVPSDRKETKEYDRRETNGGTLRGVGEQTRSIRVGSERNANDAAPPQPARPNGVSQPETARAELPFGAQLPVRLVGQISSLNAQIPIRLELVDDYTVGNLRLARGTQFIAEMYNAFAGRIQARVVGYIEKDAVRGERLVPIEGQVLGNDAAPGLIGTERTVRTGKRSPLTAALGRVGQVGLSAARGVLYGLGVGGQIGAQAIDAAATPELYVYQDSNGYLRYVEVAAGTTGYVLVTAIPQVK